MALVALVALVVLVVLVVLRTSVCPFARTHARTN